MLLILKFFMRTHFLFIFELAYIRNAKVIDFIPIISLVKRPYSSINIMTNKAFNAF